MILLDANVVSELLRPSPDPMVEIWVAAHPITDLYFSVIGESALRHGIAILPDGGRRDALLSVIDAILQEDFAERILPFDSGAARAFAAIAASQHTVRMTSLSNCLTAAIARSRNMTVATRNSREFDGMGIELFNPWTFT